MHSISENLKKIRTDRGWTQQQMADVLFVTRQTVSNWENGKSMPDLDMLASISEKLDTDINYLLYGPPEENSNMKKDIKISFRLIVTGLVFRLLRIPVGLTDHGFSTFRIFCKNYLAVIFAYTGFGMFVCQFMKGVNFINRTPEYKYSKYLRYTFFALYILQFILLLPYAIRECLFYLSILNYPRPYAGIENAVFSMYKAVNRAFFSGSNTILSSLRNYIVIKIFNTAVFFPLIAFAAGFIYDVSKPFNGPVNIPAFSKIKAFIESPADYINLFLLTVKNNTQLYKKELMLLTAVFFVSGFAYMAAGFVCDWKDITEESLRYMAYEQKTPMMLCHIMQKHISIPMMWLSAGRIGATMVKIAGFSLSVKLKKRFRLIFSLYLSVYFALMLINDVHYFILLWQSKGLMADSAISNTFTVFMRFPPGIMKKSYRFFHNGTNGGRLMKIFVFSLPAFITNLTNKKAAH